MAIGETIDCEECDDAYTMVDCENCEDGEIKI